MKLLSLLPLCLLFLSTGSCNGQQRKPTPSQLTKQQEEQEFINCSCVIKNTFSIGERRNFYPFSKSYLVKLTSFDAEPDSNGIIATGGNQLPIRDGKVDYKRLYEVVELNQTAIDSLTQILYNITYKKGPSIQKSSCFNPRHAIIFTDSLGNDFAYIQICFECNSYELSSKNIIAGDFCTEKYDLLSAFFKAENIKQGFPDRN